MLSMFNAMAALRYRLKAGFWPLFLALATVVIAAFGAWNQHVSYESAQSAQEGAPALLPLVGLSSLILSVLTCNALLRGLVSKADSNILRSKADRLVYASAHVLMSLGISAATVSLSVATGLAAHALFGLPLDGLDLPWVLAWICQAALVMWSECLVGLCVGYACRRPGLPTLVMVLVSVGVPGTALATPFMAAGAMDIGWWLAHHQPSAWFTSLGQDVLLDGVSLAVLALSCAVLVALLLVVSARRKLK